MNILIKVMTIVGPDLRLGLRLRTSAPTSPLIRMGKSSRCSPVPPTVAHDTVAGTLVVGVTLVGATVVGVTVVGVTRRRA
jgi:hypothetical protein